MPDERLPHLSDNEWAALDAFVSRLREHYSDQLVRVVLFGSKARGDSDAESDLDVLIVHPGDSDQRRVAADAGLHLNLCHLPSNPGPPSSPGRCPGVWSESFHSPWSG